MKEDLRVQKTYKALCDSFLQLLSRKKFEEITINELCETAMIRRATFYKHFEDKYDFFAFFVRKMRIHMTADLAPEEVENLTPNDYCLRLFTEFIHFIGSNRQIVNSVLNSSAFTSIFEILSDEIHDHMLGTLRSKQKKGDLLPVDLGILASFYTGAVIQVTYHWIISSWPA